MYEEDRSREARFPARRALFSAGEGGRMKICVDYSAASCMASNR